MGALDDIREQIEIRNFTPAGFNDPVTEFKGNLVEFETEEAKYQGEATGRTNVVLHFSDIDIIASTEPYSYPNKDISITYSKKQGSRWHIFSESLVKLLTDDEKFSDVKGRRMHLKTEVHKLWQGKERGTQDANCWIVASISDGASKRTGGASSVSAEKQLIILINGRTEQQFNMEALRLPAVRSDSSLSSRLINKTWFAEIVSRGLVTKDDSGVYSLTEAGILASVQE